MNKLILILIFIYNENKILHDKRREMMSNILLVYASTTGNTEVMAEAIADYLIVHGQEVVIKSFDFDRIDVEMIADYDAVLVGRSEEHTSELQSRGHLVC